jgi:hypothetical protein
MATPKTEKQEHVTLFGEDVSDDRSAGDTGNIVFGVIIITAGLILLANNFGLVDWRFWQAILFLWPFLLVLIGFQILLGQGLLARLGMLVVSLTLVAPGRHLRLKSHQLASSASTSPRP